MAGQDAGVLVDQDRVGPTELDHAGRDLVDLRLAVRARVALVRAQPLDRPQLDPVRERDQPGALRCIGQVRTSCDRCDGRDRVPDSQQNPGMLASLLCLVVGLTIASPVVFGIGPGRSRSRQGPRWRPSGSDPTTAAAPPARVDPMSMQEQHHLQGPAPSVASRLRRRTPWLMEGTGLATNPASTC